MTLHGHRKLPFQSRKLAWRQLRKQFWSSLMSEEKLLFSFFICSFRCFLCSSSEAECPHQLQFTHVEYLTAFGVSSPNIKQCWTYCSCGVALSSITDDSETSPINVRLDIQITWRGTRRPTQARLVSVNQYRLHF